MTQKFFRGWLAAGLVLPLLLSSGAAFADTALDCKRAASPDLRVLACTTLIKSAQGTTAERARLFRQRGAAYALLRREKEAVADFSSAIRLKPDYALAYVGRGNTKLALRDNDGAFKDYSSAIKIMPRFAPALVARGYTLMVKGKLEEAVSDFSAAIAAAPRSATAFNNRGLANRKLGKTGKAIGDYTKAIALNPIYALAYNNRGYAYEAAGKKNDAIADLKTALAIDPSLSEARAGLKRLGVAAKSSAETAALIANGKALAEANCAKCHAIGAKGKSANSKAPPFRVIHQRHPILALREPLMRSIAYPHDEMPKFKLSDAQIDTVVAYINSLPRRRR